MAPPARPAPDRPDLLDTRGPRVLLYAERPARRMVQLLTDLAVVMWAVVGVSLALALRDLVLALQAPGRGLAEAGDRVRGTFDGASGAADGLPLVGGRLADALGGGSRAGQSLVDAGNAQVAAVGTVATVLAWLVVAVLVAPVVAVWGFARVRWVLRARAALAARTADVDLLALRALTRASPGRLRRVAPDAAAAWRRGDGPTMVRLADVELSRMGLRGPTSVVVPRSEQS